MKIIFVNLTLLFRATFAYILKVFLSLKKISIFYNREGFSNDGKEWETLQTIIVSSR